MSRALVVQHVALEGPGRFAQWLPSYGVELDVVRPYAGDALPDVLEAEALIVMGGPMGAYDDEAAAWLPAVKRLLAAAVDAGIPTLGVCLGAQLLAVATGGRVERGGNGPEIGLGEVEVHTPDSLLALGAVPVVQWHFDTVTELPPGAELLASSAAYPVQAYRVGAAAWGLQYHVEADPHLVAEWVRAEDRDERDVLAPIRAADASIAAAGEQVALRFAAVVNERAAQG
ncbi:MAG TPA: type 1 glutamine amidotransferase [Mycobacteriales bacterium]|nr:type 1 glutamine amidotransferase [Mycobacteriales bacterium]